MSTITKEFTKEQLIEHLRTRIEHRKGLIASMHIDRGYRDYLKLELRSSEIALVSLEAEQVGCDACGGNGSVDIDHGEMGIEHIECPKCYAAPPAPLEIADLHRKAEIHDALCEKYKVESLTDFVAWQRNHIAELEAAPPAPVGPGETAVMPDYPGYALTQRECFEAGAKKAVPDGWVAVLIEPTYQMCEAMGLPWESPRFPDRYKAMIAAAPQQEVK